MPELVGLGVQTPDVFGKLGQLLNLRHAAAQAQMAQQDATQRKNIAAYDWQQHVGPDGVLDVQSFASDPDAPHIFGDKYVDYLEHAAVARQQGLAAIDKLRSLRTEQRRDLASFLGSLRSDQDVAEDKPGADGRQETGPGRQKANEAVINFVKTYGADALPIAETYGPVLKHTPPGQLANSIKNIQLNALSADQQVSAQQPGYTSTGRVLRPTNPNAVAGTPDIPLNIQPGSQATVDTDQLGNKFITFRDAAGNIVGTQDLGGGQGGPARFGPGERHTFESQAQTNFENVSANRSAASMAPQQLDQINKALDLSKQVSTGSWASKRASVESGLGSLIPGYEGMDDASKLQELDKFAERIATDASKVLGVNAKTDAERESIHKQNANIGYTPQAIQSVLKYAKAQTLAMQAKGDAQEEWLKKDGNKITNQHEFETEFRKAYDPRIFQYEVMSPSEQEKFIKSLSKEDRKVIAEKSRKLVDMGAISDGEVD